MATGVDRSDPAEKLTDPAKRQTGDVEVSGDLIASAYWRGASPKAFLKSRVNCDGFAYPANSAAPAIVVFSFRRCCSALSNLTCLRNCIGDWP
jgi:hypothetical protein